MFDENIEIDEEFISLCSEGNEKAWDCLVKRFSSLVQRAIRHKAVRYLPRVNNDDINDIFQQTFAHIWRTNALSRIVSPRSVPAYLVIIAQNITIDFLKNRSRQKPRAACSEYYKFITTQQPSPRSEAYNKQISSSIADLIKTLTLKEERIITLDLLYDLKHREIALVMDMPVNTVSTIIHRVKKFLKKRLREKGYDVK